MALLHRKGLKYPKPLSLLSISILYVNHIYKGIENVGSTSRCFISQGMKDQHVNMSYSFKSVPKKKREREK